MGAIADRQEVLSNDNEEINNTQLKEEIHEEVNLIKLMDLDDIPLEEIRRKLNKKYEKLVPKSEINEIIKEHNINKFEYKLVNNVI